MFRRLLSGFLFGAGFGLAFVVVWTAWYVWVVPRLFPVSWGPTSTISERELVPELNELVTPPALGKQPRFLGSPGIYAGDFLDNRNGVLSGGDGVISGRITTEQGPVEGLHIRLALNGSVMSKWGQTDSNGTYRIAVPFGEYRIDGYEIDHRVANNVLSGKIDNPRNPHSTAAFTVSAETQGQGLNLSYIEPVSKIAPRGDIRLTEDIIASWSPYPGASQYVIQVYEDSDPHAYTGHNALFKWRKRPRVTEPLINLTERDVPLKVGFYYTVEVVALDENGGVIAQSARIGFEKAERVNDFETPGVRI